MGVFRSWLAWTHHSHSSILWQIRQKHKVVFLKHITSTNQPFRIFFLLDLQTVPFLHIEVEFQNIFSSDQDCGSFLFAYAGEERWRIPVLLNFDVSFQYEIIVLIFCFFHSQNTNLVLRTSVNNVFGRIEAYTAIGIIQNFIFFIIFFHLFTTFRQIALFFPYLELPKTENKRIVFFFRRHNQTCFLRWFFVVIDDHFFH